MRKSQHESILPKNVDLYVAFALILAGICIEQFIFDQPEQVAIEQSQQKESDRD